MENKPRNKGFPAQTKGYMQFCLNCIDTAQNVKELFSYKVPLRYQKYHLNSRSGRGEVLCPVR